MMKNKFLLIVFFCTVVSPAISFSQRDGYLQVFGNIRNDSTNIEGAAIKIMKNNEVLVTLSTAASGKFSFELPFNGEYMMSVSKQGFRTSSISISTMVPDKEKEIIFQFKINLKLFTATGDAQAAIDKPVARIAYSSTYQDFDFNKIK
jgi:hypothetical protein